MLSRFGRYSIDPYPAVGGRRAVLVTDASGNKWVYRRSEIDPGGLERSFIHNRGDEPSFGDEDPIPGYVLPDVFERVLPGGAGGDGAPVAAPATQTSVLFTINGTTTPGQIIGFPHNVALSAVVSFLGGANQPATPGEIINFFAQLSTGGTVFQFASIALTAGAPYTAANPTFNLNGSIGFASGNIYFTQAVYGGDALNLTSKSNIVILNIGGG